MTAEPRPHIARLKSFCETQVAMTVGDKRLTFGCWACGGLGHSPPVALSRLAALWREQEGFRHQNRPCRSQCLRPGRFRAFYRKALGLSVGAGVASSLLASMARYGKYVLTLWEQRHCQFKMHRPELHHLLSRRAVEEVNRTKGILNTLGPQWTEGTPLYHEGPRQPEFTLAILTVRGSNCMLRRTRENPRKRDGSAPVGS